MSQPSQPMTVRVDVGLFAQVQILSTVLGVSLRDVVNQALKRQVIAMTDAGGEELAKAIQAVENYRRTVEKP